MKQADGFYLSPAWRRFRDAYISRHPLCEHCQGQGRDVPAFIVDHVIELKDAGAPYDAANVQALCRHCHNVKTKCERRKRGATLYEYS